MTSCEAHQSGNYGFSSLKTYIKIIIRITLSAMIYSHLGEVVVSMKITASILPTYIFFNDYIQR